MNRDQLQTVLAQPTVVDTMVADPTQQRLLLDAMLAHIGDPDPQLRDGDAGIYLTFVRLITEELLPREAIYPLLALVTNQDHLFYRLGEEASDSDFTRSFSVLLIPLLLYIHQEAALFSAAEIMQAKEAVLRYIAGERDRRGYLPEQGWAHAVAHSADALQWLAHCDECGRIDLLDLLSAIAALATAASPVYADDEEDRLSAAALALVERNLLTAADWQAWLQHEVAVIQAGAKTPQQRAQVTNFKRFLASFYVRLGNPSDGTPAEPATVALLIKMVAATLAELVHP